MVPFGKRIITKHDEAISLYCSVVDCVQMMVWKTWIYMIFIFLHKILQFPS